MVHHHKVDFLVKRLDCSVVVMVKVTEIVQNSSEWSFGRYLLSCWTFCNKTWYGDATSWAKVSCKSSSSRSQWGLIWSDMTVCTISAELLIFLRPNLIGWHIIVSLSALCKNYIFVFKVKITVQVQNFIESLCILYLKYHWSLCNQSYADLLFIITKPSTTEWAYTDSSTLSYTITRHTMGEGGFYSCFHRHSNTTHWVVSPPNYPLFKCSSLHWASLWCVILLSRQAAKLGLVQEVLAFGMWVSPCCLEPILLLEQGVGDDKLVLRTELQKQAPIVIAISSSMSI